MGMGNPNFRDHLKFPILMTAVHSHFTIAVDVIRSISLLIQC